MHYIFYIFHVDILLYSYGIITIIIQYYYRIMYTFFLVQKCLFYIIFLITSRECLTTKNVLAKNFKIHIFLKFLRLCPFF